MIIGRSSLTAAKMHAIHKRRISLAQARRGHPPRDLTDQALAHRRHRGLLHVHLTEWTLDDFHNDGIVRHLLRRARRRKPNNADALPMRPPPVTDSRAESGDSMAVFVNFEKRRDLPPGPDSQFTYRAACNAIRL